MSQITHMVTLADGRQVHSDSEEWRAECEARHILAMSMGERAEVFIAIQAKRGEAAAKALKMRCFELEPAYVLGLPNRELRNRYIATVEQRFGPNAAETLKAKVRALHEQRKVAAEAAQPA